MKKKAILTVAAAAALMMPNPVLNKAHAATTSPSLQEKVYVFQGSNMDEINSVVEKYLASLGFTFSQNTVKQPVQAQPNQTVPTQEPAQTATPQPVQQQPVTATPPSSTPTTSSLSAYEQKVVDLTNQERAKNGLPALKVDVTLSKMAHEKSRDMSANGYFSHTSPTYGSPFDMMKKYDITYRYAGENIAMGQRTPEEVVKAWMNSEGHRKNILSPNYNYIGVGYVSQGNYWTQEFIGK
ncbi:sporulation protein [Bacillus sp. ISL-40]|uniref:CAP domain-containing protein n=1 Tax=unclassified Bacillus (in: firmicutes) TaxID=185979 RepID=UPI001BEBC3DE|nr:MULTISPECIES: CAP domain-containing protein [unclassified Bacillus (in: firmicutes)]MBT2697525.1 sporulation protein [Bacillus sp. ISL-40]MBT2720925.1 sporulation protein [Bacillus sp. ISL-46]MBT2742230.1 sporulation protein [Bacillus sp. ISL-77]